MSPPASSLATAGFTRLAPQLVEHADGYRVFIADRYHLGYEDASRSALVAADLEGPVVLVEAGTLRWTAPEESPPTAEQSEVLLARITAGMSAMGDLAQIV